MTRLLIAIFILPFSLDIRQINNKINSGKGHTNRLQWIEWSTFGLKLIFILGSKSSYFLIENWESAGSLTKFKIKSKPWISISCPCNLGKRPIPNLGYIGQSLWKIWSHRYSEFIEFVYASMNLSFLSLVYSNFDSF